MTASLPDPATGFPKVTPTGATIPPTTSSQNVHHLLIPAGATKDLVVVFISCPRLGSPAMTGMSLTDIDERTVKVNSMWIKWGFTTSDEGGRLTFTFPRAEGVSVFGFRLSGAQVPRFVDGRRSGDTNNWVAEMPSWTPGVSPPHTFVCQYALAETVVYVPATSKPDVGPYDGSMMTNYQNGTPHLYLFWKIGTGRIEVISLSGRDSTASRTLGGVQPYSGRLMVSAIRAAEQTRRIAAAEAADAFSGWGKVLI